jgi:Kef-type K+ transport system membrane component KefB
VPIAFVVLTVIALFGTPLAVLGVPGMYVNGVVSVAVATAVTQITLRLIARDDRAAEVIAVGSVVLACFMGMGMLAIVFSGFMGSEPRTSTEILALCLKVALVATGPAILGAIGVRWAEAVQHRHRVADHSG